MKWLALSFLVIIALVNFGPRVYAVFYSQPDTTVVFKEGCFLKGELKIDPVNLSYYLILNDDREVSIADDGYAQMSSQDTPIDSSELALCL